MSGAADPMAALEAEFDALAAEIELAMSLAGQGQMLELTGFDARIVAACQAAQALPGPAAKAMVDRLGQLVGLLDRLAAELVHHFGNIPQEADPRTAAQAYGKGSSVRGG